MNLINGPSEVGKRLECGLARVIIWFIFKFYFNLLFFLFELKFTLFVLIHHLSSSFFTPSIITFSVISAQPVVSFQALHLTKNNYA